MLTEGLSFPQTPSACATLAFRARTLTLFDASAIDSAPLSRSIASSYNWCIFAAPIGVPETVLLEYTKSSKKSAMYILTIAAVRCARTRS